MIRIYFRRMKCSLCHRVAQNKCVSCQTRFYCSSLCQTHDWFRGVHADYCMPIAGKRKPEEERERKERAESDFVKRLAAYKRDPSEQLISILEELYGNMSEEARARYADDLPCHENRTVISLDNVSELEPSNRIYVFDNNIKRCYNLDTLSGYIFRMGDEAIHPMSRQPFTQAELNRIQKAQQGRLPVLWEKYRKAKMERMLEIEDLMFNSYGISETIIEGERRNKGRNLLDSLYYRPNELKKSMSVLLDFYKLSKEDFDMSKLDEEGKTLLNKYAPKVYKLALGIEFMDINSKDFIRDAWVGLFRLNIQANLYESFKNAYVALKNRLPSNAVDIFLEGQWSTDRKMEWNALGYGNLEAHLWKNPPSNEDGSEIILNLKVIAFIENDENRITYRLGVEVDIQSMDGDLVADYWVGNFHVPVEETIFASFRNTYNQVKDQITPAGIQTEELMGQWSNDPTREWNILGYGDFEQNRWQDPPAPGEGNEEITLNLKVIIVEDDDDEE